MQKLPVVRERLCLSLSIKEEGTGPWRASFRNGLTFWHFCYWHKWCFTICLFSSKKTKDKKTNKQTKKNKDQDGEILWIYVTDSRNIYVWGGCISFVGLHLWHMEVSRLGVKLELSCWPSHSHSNARSELHLQPTSQLTAMPDP